ncbi:MAG: hypothetical protein FGM32_05480 [Candidatus Kapabacteria bacterium]|nr:hypothetical protein [Candidatus Kapabacteria bacterium]
MMPNDIQQELREQLSEHGLPVNELGPNMTAHKHRRDAAIESATSTMSMRVQRALNAQSVGRPRAARLALALTAAAATVIMVVTFHPDRGTTTQGSDSTSFGTISTHATERDVDALTDELVRRSSTSAAGWAVTDDDVDRLLGDAGLDL